MVCIDNPSKFLYIPNFADEELFPYKRSVYSSNDESILLHPRRLVKYRGYQLFIEMCEKLKRKGYNIKPVIAFGKTKSDDYSNLFDNKLCQYTIVHPELDEIPSLYSKAFLTFVPTIWSEGTSLSAIESICSGCPVISSNVGGLGNIIIPDFTGDIVAPTVDSFVKSTEKVINDPQIRNRWAENCALVRSSFTTSTWNKKIIEIIEEFER